MKPQGLQGRFSMLENCLWETAVLLGRQDKDSQRHTSCVGRKQCHTMPRKSEPHSLPERPCLSIYNRQDLVPTTLRWSSPDNRMFEVSPLTLSWLDSIPICIPFSLHAALTKPVGAKPSQGAVCLWPSICLQVVNCNFDQRWVLFCTAAPAVAGSSLIFLESLHCLPEPPVFQPNSSAADNLLAPVLALDHTRGLFYSRLMVITLMQHGSYQWKDYL